MTKVVLLFLQPNKTKQNICTNAVNFPRIISNLQ